MIEAFITVKGGRIAGKTAADAEALGEMEDGDYRAQFTRPGKRSLSQNGLYWLFCEFLADHAPEPDDGEVWTKDAISDVLKLSAGHWTPRQLADGTLYRVPKSIAFNKMPAHEFSAYMDVAFNAATAKFGAAMSESDFAEMLRLMQPEQRQAA